MAKISQLPLVAEPDGSETIPMVKGGQTRRGAIGSLVGAVAAPHVAAAQMARDQAADLVLPQNIFVDVPLATAQEAVAQGAAFKIVDTPSGLVTVYQRTADGSNELYKETTTAALGSDSGGQMVKSKRDHPAAVPLTAEALFQRTLDARELGVMPDAEDNTDAMQGVIGYSINNGHRLRLPKGNIIVRELEIPSYLQMTGESHYQTRLTHKAGETGPMVTIPEGPVIDVQIANLHVFGNDEGHAGEHGLYFHGRPAAGGPNGGLWYSSLRDIRVAKFAGKAIWFRGDATDDPADAPDQFINLHNVTSQRSRSATSRSLSITGKVGQIYTSGFTLFECDEPTPEPWLGCNVCVSREFVNGGVPGDAFDGGSAVSDQSPYSIKLTMTCQNAALGVLIDRGQGVDVDQSYFENLRSGVAVQNSAIASVTNSEFRSAASDGAGTGYGVRNENSTVRRGGNTFLGAVDRRYVNVSARGDSYSGGDSGSFSSSANTSGILQNIADDGAGGITISGNESILLNGNAAPNSIATITSTHSTGAVVYLEINGGLAKFVNGGNISVPGGSDAFLLLRANDTITFKKMDNYWAIMGVVRAPLRSADMPASGYYEAGEFVSNTGPSVDGNGVVIFGWVRLTTGTSHIAEADWAVVRTNLS